MAQYEAFEDGVEVKGETVASIIAGIPSAFEDRAFDILAEHGIEDLDPDAWYPQQNYLDAFEAIDETVGSNTLRQIGQSIPEEAAWPDDIDSVVGGLESIDEAYHLNHRGGAIGSYEATQIDDSTVRVTCENPYACVFDQGLIEAVATEFLGIAVPSVEEIGTECRAEGGRQCEYEVTW